MKIVVTPRGFAKCGLDNVKIIEDAGFELDYNNTPNAYTEQEFYKKTMDADGIIVGVEIDSYYSGNGISLLKDHTYGITVYEASDNNGAGCKEYTEYRFLIVFPKGYAESL